MLNYIWLSLVVIGIAVALWNDAADLSSNRFHNGEEIGIEISGVPPPPVTPSRVYSARMTVNPSDYNSVYGD